MTSEMLDHTSLMYTTKLARLSFDELSVQKSILMASPSTLKNSALGTGRKIRPAIITVLMGCSR